MVKKQDGFTLIELMVVLVMVAVLSAIAIPGYQNYSRRADLADVQKEVLSIALQLERYKSRNFSYAGFDPTFLYANKVTVTDSKATLSFPPGSVGNAKKYTIELIDLDKKIGLTAPTADGRNWGITAIKNSTTSQAKNYDLLITSTGLKCMTKVSSIELTSYTGCGAKSENW